MATTLEPSFKLDSAKTIIACMNVAGIGLYESLYFFANQKYKMTVTTGQYFIILVNGKMTYQNS
jgi:hypothetical protein